MLSVSSLSFSRGHRCLFADVNFTLQPGQWLHVEGGNGVGKTTLLRLICGLNALEQGEMTWHNQSVAKDPDIFRAELAYLGHPLALKEDLTPVENILASAAVCGLHLSQGDAMAALTKMGLEGAAHLPVRVLSQGQKRRTALARLVVSDARLWILDEPFVALDTPAQQVLCDVLNAHLNRQGMLLLTSHQAVNLAGQGQTYRLSA